ncbi:ATP-dependent nuclease [Helicobacter pametensis]|uniref:ATP-dependent nuclease n=1 Tax=Helicobacter pametensis TaxID=95149 RepID=UPI0004852B0B|nr:AAA family ATPase [Helicobacter pametensis]
MKLKRILISNFRSIEDIELPIKAINGSYCTVLVGKNEAGKSNILKAINTLFQEQKPSKEEGLKDRRRTTEYDIKQEEYFVCAEYTLTDVEKETILKKIDEEYININLVKFKNGLTLLDLLNVAYKEVLLDYIIGDQDSTKRWWNCDEKIKQYELEQDVFLVDKVFSTQGDRENLLEVQKLVDQILRSYIPDFPKIDCQMWSYKKEYLLPPNVELDRFFSDPNTCIPLKNLFHLGGVKNIVETYNQTNGDSKQVRTLLKRVQNKATEKFREIWKDFEKIDFVLNKDGNNLEISIRDSNSEIEYAMEERSEGFKRFVTILLTLSVGNSDSLKIILLDEPDAFLYPSSAKQLRDVLIKMGENNIIFYSTHSPYMIDINAVGENSRHLIVEREDGITQINKKDSMAIEGVDFMEDELIMRAIGSNIFERVKPINILFEGYLDKMLFEKFLEKEFCNKYGMIYLGGIKKVDRCVNDIQLTGQKFLVVADSDQVSRQEREKFKKDFVSFANCWLDYSEVDKQCESLEDFFKNEYIKKTLEEMGFSVDKYNPRKSAITNIRTCISLNTKDECGFAQEEIEKILEYIKQYKDNQELAKRIIDEVKENQKKNIQEKKEELEKEVKQKLAHKAKKEHMKEEFFMFIKRLKEKIQSI